LWFVGAPPGSCERGRVRCFAVFCWSFSFG
jgi:hypothetical protein